MARRYLGQEKQFAADADAGDHLFVGGNPVCVRMATEIAVEDSPVFSTTMTEVQFVTATLEVGRTYRIRFKGNFVSDTSGDGLTVQIQEDHSTGNVLDRGKLTIDSTSGIGWPIVLEAEYVAASSGQKTFIVAAERTAGSGSIHRQGSSNVQASLYVDYIRG